MDETSTVARVRQTAGLALAVALLAASGASAQPSWSATGRMLNKRSNQTATLLPNGKILVAGGFGDFSYTATASAELYDPVTGTWQATGSMTVPRAHHTATLLPTGRVLVAAGSADQSAVIHYTAELYDPATGTWAATGSLNILRNRHTATLLPDGKVLVTGGVLGQRSTELYDPGSGTWTPTGQMATARSRHTATLLPDGKVLVAGGYDLVGPVASAELYDPAAQTWSATGPLATERAEHSATLLPDGNVLVAGGISNLLILSSAELYDPGAGTWTATGSLTTARYGHTADLLPGGRVVVSGSSAGNVSSAELFDPGSSTWSAAGSMSIPRAGHVAALLPNGKVLAAGGESGSVKDSAELFDPGDAGAWSPTGSLASGRFITLTLLPDGKVLAAGHHSTSFPSVERYDPALGTWTVAAPLLTERSNHAAALLPGGKVLVSGGLDTGGAGLSSAELFDPDAGSWTATGAMASERASHTATLLAGGKVLVVSDSTAELYDPGAGSWAPTGPPVTPAREKFHTATLLPNGKVLLAGGLGSGGVLYSAELFDPAAGTWSLTGSLATERWGHTATLLPNGKVLVTGGFSGASLASAELYDPATGAWTPTGSLATARRGHAATLLPNGKVLITGGLGSTFLDSAELYDPATGTWTAAGSFDGARSQHVALLLLNGKVLLAGGLQAVVSLHALAVAGDAPAIASATPTPLAYGTVLTVTGTDLGGGSEGGNGRTQSAAVNYPLFQMRSVGGERVSWLAPDGRPNFSDDPMSLTFSTLPPALDRGWHYLTPVRAGISGASRLVEVGCSLSIAQQPASQMVALGSTLTFTVAAPGARALQWRKNGAEVPGAQGFAYTTPPATAADSGSVYDVVVRGACADAGSSCPVAGQGTACLTSAPAVLTVEDTTPPAAAVLSPSGGEYLMLSGSGGPANSHLVTWSMSDDVRICRVEASLQYSNDGGGSYADVPNPHNLTPTGPVVFGPGGTCGYPGVTTTSALYTIPAAFPSGTAGSLYRIRVGVTDLETSAGARTTTVTSANPFYIVQPNPDAVRTLILKNTARMQAQMGIGAPQAAALDGKIQELADHPRVQGFVVELSGISSVSDLYAAWDGDPSSPDRANQVLFGCHVPFPAGCTADQNGIHDTIRTLLQVYTGAKYLILAGDDRIIPFARIQDRTVLLPESAYPAGSDLTPSGTTVGQALAANKYLSDDPLAVVDPIRPDSLSAALYVPDLAVGRLVETPAEITTAIATFISQDGVLDLSTLDASTGHKVLVTGYDFLSDSAKQIGNRWRAAFDPVPPDPDPDPLAPVDSQLLGGTWGLSSVSERVDALEEHLSGNGGLRYGVMSLSGHANHYKEGVPGTNPQDIHGLEASGVASLDLAGGVVYAVGCHGGLAVAGSNPGDADHSLDLPQTFLSRGVVAYVANTGFGWGLKHGIGYGERLVQLLTEEMTKGGTVVTGDAVKKTKQRYFLETPRYDAYDEKSLMQWALFGLPMYAVKTGLAAGGQSLLAPPVEGKVEGLKRTASFGGVRVEREAPSQLTQALPSFLTQLNLHFDFTAPGVYRKWTAEGDELPDVPGCSNPTGCYYTLNGLVERSSGAGDLPVQPYFIYDSRLSGTSQHGVLWKGGVYDQETGWIPVIGELQSNGGDGSNHGSSPEVGMADAIAPRLVPGKDPDQCRPSDLELNSLVVGAGEAMKDQTTLQYSIERRYRQIDLEVFYFNDTNPGQYNCDRDGPVIPQQAAYHTLTGSTLNFAVPASDPEGVWRVLVVVNDNSTTGGQGQWVPVELQDAGGGLWVGSRLATSSRMTYVIQAVDNRGNVTWVEYQGAVLPASGVPLGIPLPVMVNTPPPSSSLSIDDVNVPEGNAGPTTATFTVTLTPAATATTTVNWATAPNTATSPLDFVTASGTLTFEVGQSMKTIDVTVNGDLLFETPETFLVNLSGASGATIVDSLGVGTIANDDALPSLSIGDVTLSEGNSGSTTATFTVTLSPASGIQATVNYTTQDVTAQAGSDYATSSGMLTFAPGETTQTISVTINGDVEPEPDETFQVGLSGVAYASILDGTGAGTILNDDVGAARTFVSVLGADTNDCSNIATPCRTLNAAIAQVAVDGEVIVTKTGSYAGATIGKGVKLTAAPGIVAFSGQPVVVNAPGATVVIRGLTIKAVTPGTGNGVLAQSAGAVFVESSVIDGWDVGIRQQGAAEVFVKDTTLRNANTGVFATAGKTAIENARLLSNGIGLRAQGGDVSVRGSTFSGNATAGISAETGASVTVEKCQLANNGTGVTLPAASGATVRLSRSVVSGNTLGLENVGGTLEVSGNNAVRGNATNSSGTLTPAGLQ